MADHRLSRPELRVRSRPVGLAWSLAAGLGAAAASTVCTLGAAAAAGRQADLALEPIELALRVGLLLAAPCAGALLAAIAIPRGGHQALAAIGIGVPIGPLLVLRLDRMSQFGAVPALLTVAILVLWGIAGTLLASSWWHRPSRAVESTALPGPGPDPPEPAPDPLEPPGPGAPMGVAGGAAGRGAEPAQPSEPPESPEPPRPPGGAAA